MKIPHALLSVVCIGLMAGNAHAVYVGIDSVTHSGGSGPVANDAILSSFVADGITYSSLTPATASGESSTNIFVGDDSVLYPNPPGTTFPTGIESYTDLNLTTGVNQTTNNAEFQFSGLTASSIVYMFEFASLDDPILRLVDGAGNQIPGDFRLNIVDGDWGQSIQIDTRGAADGVFDLNGLIFSIDEFKANVNSGSITIGDNYSGTNATGFAIPVARGIDIVDVGLATAVPEPSSLILMFSAITLLAFFRRRL